MLGWQTRAAYKMPQQRGKRWHALRGIGKTKLWSGECHVNTDPFKTVQGWKTTDRSIKASLSQSLSEWNTVWQSLRTQNGLFFLNDFWKCIKPSRQITEHFICKIFTFLALLVLLWEIIWLLLNARKGERCPAIEACQDDARTSSTWNEDERQEVNKRDTFFSSSSCKQLEDRPVSTIKQLLMQMFSINSVSAYHIEFFMHVLWGLDNYTFNVHHS